MRVVDCNQFSKSAEKDNTFIRKPLVTPCRKELNDKHCFQNEEPSSTMEDSNGTFITRPSVTPCGEEPNGNCCLQNEETSSMEELTYAQLYGTANEKFKSTIRYLNSPSKRRWYLDQLSSLRAHVIQQATSGTEMELNTKATGVVSLPSFDKCQKSKRICTPGSPPRKRGKRCIVGL